MKIAIIFSLIGLFSYAEDKAQESLDFNKIEQQEKEFEALVRQNQKELGITDISEAIDDRELASEE